MTLHYFKIRAAYHGGSCRIILAWSCVVLNGIAQYGIVIGMASVWYCMIWYSICNTDSVCYCLASYGSSVSRRQLPHHAGIPRLQQAITFFQPECEFHKIMRTQIQDVKLDNLLICPGVGKMLLTFEQMAQQRTVNFLWYRLDNEVFPRSASFWKRSIHRLRYLSSGRSIRFLQ